MRFVAVSVAPHSRHLLTSSSLQLIKDGGAGVGEYALDPDGIERAFGVGASLVPRMRAI